jgi:hypothetical protein
MHTADRAGKQETELSVKCAQRSIEQRGSVLETMALVDDLSGNVKAIR